MLEFFLNHYLHKTALILGCGCQDLIAGGTESSAITVEWAMSEILKNPEVFAKATEELDRVVGRGRWVTEQPSRTSPLSPTWRPS
jgi:cytochrome P450